jgi:hypothetical protein
MWGGFFVGNNLPVISNDREKSCSLCKFTAYHSNKISPRTSVEMTSFVFKRFAIAQHHRGLKMLNNKI